MSNVIRFVAIFNYLDDMFDIMHGHAMFFRIPLFYNTLLVITH